MKTFKWILLVLGCSSAVITSIVYILQHIYNVKIEWEHWVYGLSYSVSVISILLSTMAHTQQQKYLNKIDEKVQNLVERQKDRADTGNEWLEPIYQNSAITEILLYAMYKARTVHPFSIERILPEDIELVSILLDNIFSAYQHDVLYGYITRNNYLVVDCFDANKIPVKIDGRSFGNNYNNQIKELKP